MSRWAEAWVAALFHQMEQVRGDAECPGGGSSWAASLSLEGVAGRLAPAETQPSFLLAASLLTLDHKSL